MRVRKIVISILIGLMLLAICSAVNAQETVTLKWVSQAGGMAKKILDQSFRIFEEKHPNIKVDHIAIPARGWYDYFQKVSVMVAGGTPPDSGWVAIEGNHLLIDKGMLEPLDKYIAREREKLPLDDIHPALIRALLYQGKVYQIPFDFNNVVIWYNKKLYDKAGLPYPTEDWTINDFIEYAKKLTQDTNGDGRPDIWGFIFTNEYFNGIVPWVFRAGGSILNDYWTESTLNEPECLDALKFLNDLVHKYKVSPDPAGRLAASQAEQFVAGNVAMIQGGRWWQHTIRIQGGMTDYDVQFLPKWRTDTVEIGVGGWPIFKASKHKEETWELLKFSISKEAQTLYAKLGLTIPSRRSIAYSDEFLNPPPDNAEIYYDPTLNRSKPVPSPPEFAELREILTKEIGLVYAGEKTPEDALADAHEKINNLLKKRTYKTKYWR